MSYLGRLLEKFLTEAVALTKGSQRVMNDKNMVMNLADAIRDDARSNPSAFPAGANRTFQKAPDEELAAWFLENLDKIEREGYEGTVYSRDGANNEWLARRYIAGSHNWEDITGVANMNFRDWYALKNRNMLDPQHRDIPKFNSIRDIGRYMSTHYDRQLADVRAAAITAAAKKQAKTAKIVDNDDYRVYTVFNWAGARLIGNGTQWCTANSQYYGHYNTYSSDAMLFQLFPKDPQDVDKIVNGKRITGPEKYQFDAGNNGHFMDIADQPVKSKFIAERFPYLYKDLLKGLTDNKAQLQTALDELADNIGNQSSDVTRVKHYNIDDEIKKLKTFLDRKYFTNNSRPAAPGQSTNEPPEQHMESKKIKTEHILEAFYTEVVEQTKKQHKDEKMEINPVNESADQGVVEWMNRFKAYDNLNTKLKPVLETKACSACGKTPCVCEEEKVDEAVRGVYKTHTGYSEPSDQGDRDRLASMIKSNRSTNRAADATDERGSKIQDMDRKGHGSATHAKSTGGYMGGSAGTAHAVRGVNEESDKKDIPASQRKEKGGDWKTSLKDLEKEKDSRISDPKTMAKNRGEKVDEGEDMEEDLKQKMDPRTASQLSKKVANKKWEEHKKDEKKDEKNDSAKVNEGADPEVLSWMQRFSKLGKMGK